MISLTDAAVSCTYSWHNKGESLLPILSNLDATMLILGTLWNVDFDCDIKKGLNCAFFVLGFGLISHGFVDSEPNCDCTFHRCLIQ